MENNPAQPAAILACDVGNTRVALAGVIEDKASDIRRIGMSSACDDGCCHGDVQQFEAALAEALRQLWEELPAPRKIVAASVSPPNLAILERAAARAVPGEPVLLVGRDVPLPLAVDVEEPARVGADRVCSAAMAYEQLREACVVADFGTAITVDCVSPDGVFLGGAILPGLRLGAAALHAGTAALPRVEPCRPEWVFGKNTEQAIIGGLVHGARGALRELTEAYATELGQWPLLIVTGGDAELIVTHEEGGIIHAVVPDLCLRGIALAYHKSCLQPPNS